MSSEPNNNTALYALTVKNLVFGSSFMPDAIVKTSGVYLSTAYGKKIMD